MHANKGDSGTSDYWVVKLTTSGDIDWQKTIGGSSNDYLYCLRSTPDGGCILGGWSESSISGDKTEPSQGLSDLWFVKLTANGEIEWQNTIGGNGEEKIRAMEPLSDGGYICAAYSASGISGDKTEPCLGDFDYWVIKLNSSGEIQWQNTIGGDAEDVLRGVYSTPDGGYICGGYSKSSISGDKTEPSQGYHDFWVLKLSSTGTIEWQNTFGGSAYDKLRSIYPTFDGGYICGGYSFSGISGDKTEDREGQNDCWVVKLNSSGDIEWQNTIGGSDDDDLYWMQITPDNGYVLACYSKSSVSGDKTQPSQGGWDYWIVKLTSTGNLEWQKTIGGSGDDELISIELTLDGGYICGGFSNSGISGDKTEESNGDYDYWVIKIGCIPVDWFADVDGDGYGDADISISDCINPGNYVTNSLDCNDIKPSVNPGATESENGIDDNCNGVIDDGFCIAPFNLKTTKITATTCVLNWSGNNEAYKYRIRYKTPSSSAVLVLISNPSATHHHLSGLQPSSNYGWSIQSICGNEYSAWSEKKKFTTSALHTSQEHWKIKPDVYPNPAVGQATVTFSLPKQMMVTIRLLDVWGRVIKTITKGSFDAGNHAITFQLADLQSGVFMVQLIVKGSENSNIKIIKQ